MKETYYFSHDYNARSDGKLIKVAMRHWMEWVWAYWCIIEMLYEEWWYLKIEEYERITFELRVSYELVESLINNFGLFSKDTSKFWSDSVLDRLKQRMDKSQKARDSIKKRWEKNKEENTNVLHSNYDSNTIKERKGKEIKEKNNTTAKAVAEQAQEFWNKEINDILKALKTSVGCDTFAESEKQQRMYGKHFLNLGKNIGKEEFTNRLKIILQDNFKAKNCNKLAYLYKEIKSFIHSPIIPKKSTVV